MRFVFISIVIFFSLTSCTNINFLLDESSDSDFLNNKTVVYLGGWDNHQNIFPTLRDTKLPMLDQGMSALYEDLEQRGLLQDTAIIWMGEFSRTPRINGNAGRDHWARSWSVVVGGAGMNGGIAIGETNSDGTRVETEPYTSQDVMASVCKALGISLGTTFTSNSGRPMKIANSGKVITELFG